MRIYHTYSELLERVAAMGLPVRELGHCPDGSPIICVRSGGDKQPGIVISAGSHSTEHAGVCAAVELLEALDTEHRVYVIPTRDPIGLNGFAYALSLGLGELPDGCCFASSSLSKLRKRWGAFCGKGLHFPPHRSTSAPAGP